MATTQATGPRRVLCQHCPTIVLEVPLGGAVTVLVEAREVYPRERCRVCLSRRLRDPETVCWRCKAQPFVAGWVGEDLTGVLAVALDDHGRARPYIPSLNSRQPGEAIHKVHHCRGACAPPD